MTVPPPSWYPDPAGPRQLRYWDGSRWTVHVAPMAGGPATTGQPRGSRAGLGWAGLLLCVVAVVAVSVPGFRFAQAANHDGARLDGSTQHLDLPAHRTYGIYVDDANNSGYSEECTAVDDAGRMLRMRDPSWSISGSDTETLDLVFDTGSGKLTINCSVPGERVTARPVPDAKALMVGVLVGIVGTTVGVALLIVWLVSRQRRPRPADAAGVGQGA